jgi:hypothetical protein
MLRCLYDPFSSVVLILLFSHCQVFDRIVVYATQTYEAIRDHLLPLRASLNAHDRHVHDSELNKFHFAKKNWESVLFTTAYDDYDVLIHLEPAVCPRYSEKTKGGKPAIQMVYKQHEFYQSLHLNEISQKSGNAGCMGYLIGFDPVDMLFQTLKVWLMLCSRHIFDRTLVYIYCCLMPRIIFMFLRVLMFVSFPCDV